MNAIVYGLILWFVVSWPVGIAMGKYIAYCNRYDY